MNRRLYRSPDDRVLGGVAGGIAETYDIDPALVRVGWVLLTIATGGVFLVVYVVMALVVPLRPAGMPARPAGTDQWAGAGSPGLSAANQPRQPGQRKGNDSAGAILIGLVLIVAGGFFLARQFLPQLDLSLLWPVVVIGLGAMLILGAFTGRRSERDK